MQKTLIIDADSFAYNAAAANQEVSPFNPEVVTCGDLKWATDKVDAQFAEWQDRFKADKLIVALSCASLDCWRLDILPTYKEDRDPAKKPEQLGLVKDHMREHYKVVERDRMEADDIVGIYATHPLLVPGKRCVVSIDKDLKTIPGWLFNPQKDKKPRLISEDEADWWHMYQTLCGDTTDGYKGCPNVGDKGARYYLGMKLKREAYEHTLRGGPSKGKQEVRWRDVPANTMWEVVVSLFEHAGLTADDALVQARVARICRHTEYDFNEKRVKPWNPPQ